MYVYMYIIQNRVFSNFEVASFLKLVKYENFSLYSKFISNRKYIILSNYYIIIGLSPQNVNFIFRKNFNLKY